MTDQNTAVRRKYSAAYRRTDIHVPHRLIGAVMIAGLLLCIPTAAAEGVRSGLALCARSVIPSLFPFLVLSPILSDGIRRGMALLFRGRLCDRTAALLSAYAVGMLTGFPVGALTVLSFMGQGRIDREDAARFLGVCTGASPAFLIGYVGEALWDSPELGWILWFLQSFLCFTGVLLLLRKRPSVIVGNGTMTEEASPTLAQCLQGAVPRMLQICGCVVLFSVLRTFICRWFPTGIAVGLGGMAEMTGGLSDAAALYTEGLMDKISAMTVSAAVIGFGGGCVGMQIADAAAEAGISMRQYWLQRILLGAVSALVAAFAGLSGYGIG